MNAADARRGARWSMVSLRRLALILVSVVVALLSVNACGSTNATTSAPAQSGVAAGSNPAATGSSTAMSIIHIHDFHYTAPVSVPAGAQVEVMNMDSETHTVTADKGGFDVQAPAGQTVTLTAPTKPGRYPFHCEYHANMHGVLIVQ